MIKLEGGSSPSLGAQTVYSEDVEVQVVGQNIFEQISARDGRDVLNRMLDWRGAVFGHGMWCEA